MPQNLSFSKMFEFHDFFKFLFQLPSHPCFRLVANCEQILSSHSSRRCLVFQKVLQSADFADEQACREKVREMATQFRENFFKAQQLPRLERKERIKKYGHLNLLTGFGDELGQPVQERVTDQFGEK